MFKSKEIRSILIALFCVISSLTYSQSPDFVGKYPVRYYSNEDFNSPEQVWTATQGPNDAMFFGNNQKILRFNGIDWSPLDYQFDLNSEDSVITDEVPVTSLLTTAEGKIFVGRDGGFGYVEHNSKGRLVYKSLLTGNDIQKVWNIFETVDNGILFIDEQNFYLHKDGSVDALKLPRGFDNRKIKNVAKVTNGLIISTGKSSEKSELDWEKQLTFFYDEVNQKFSQIQFPEEVSLSNVRGAFTIGGNTYVADKISGIYSYVYANGKFQWSLLREDMFKELKSLSINCVQRKEDLIYFGTETSGVLVYNLKGKLIYQINKKDGLVDQSVFNIYFDNKGDLWMALDNGIAVVEFSSPLTYWTSEEGVSGAGEALDINNNIIYLATRTGVFVSDERRNQIIFDKVKDYKQQSFDIKVFQTNFGKRTLIVGYNGLYELSATNTIISVELSVYAWEFCQNPNNKNEIYVGGEDFVGKLTVSETGWNYEKVSSEESNVISMLFESDYLYYGVSGQGLKRLNLKTQQENLYPIIVNEGEEKSSSLYLEKFQNRIFVGQQKGLYEFVNDTMLPVNCANKDFEATEVTVHRMFNQNDEKLWMEIIEENVDKIDVKLFGFISKNEKGELIWTEIVNPILTNSGIINDVWFGKDNSVYAISGKGLYRLKYDENSPGLGSFKVYIERIKSGDSILAYNTGFANPIAHIEYGTPLKFIYASEGYSSQGITQFRTKLVGYSDNWSEWSDLNFKDFEKLPHGQFTLQIQGKNFYGKESEIAEFNFVISPPWYYTWWAYVIYGILIIAIIFAVSYFSTQRVKAQNKRLEETVQLRTQEIEKQKDEIAAKSEDILDSIVYAKRIQNTILPDKSLLQNSFNEHFVLYKPKDIVSGDFYWAKKVDNTIFWSAIDCTGHGVPGAFVSIVGNNGLLRSVNEFKAANPAAILNKLRDIVIESFESQDGDVKDGMDIALCSYDISTNKIQFAGANNPCVIIRNGEVLETKADKQPIGSFTEAKPFTNHVLEVQKGDCIYLYTDGYVDQFGGVKNKKLKSRPFKNFLVDIHHLPMTEQHERLEVFFEEWRGENEQIDDVCIFGVKI